MRKTLARAFALAASGPLVAASLVTGATAAHAVVTCPESTDVVDVDVFTAGSFRVAVRPESPTTTYICIQAITDAHAVVILRTAHSVTPPSVTSAPGAGSCPITLFEMDDPADAQLTLGMDADARTVCLGRDGVTTTFSVGLPAVNTLPSVEVWLPANTFLVMYGVCATQFARYTAEPTTRNHEIWVSCYNSDRVYPELP